MTNWDYSGGYEDGPHPDKGSHADESVADTPEVERYDAQLDPDLDPR